MKRRLIDATDLVHRVLQARDNVLTGPVRFEHAACNAERFKQAMHGGIRKVLHEIETSPTIDAVEAVRCKDCKHRGIVTECPMCYTEDSYDDDYGYDYWDVDKTVDDGFCHCGEMDAEVQDD